MTRLSNKDLVKQMADAIIRDHRMAHRVGAEIVHHTGDEQPVNIRLVASQILGGWISASNTRANEDANRRTVERSAKRRAEKAEARKNTQQDK